MKINKKYHMRMKGESKGKLRLNPRFHRAFTEKALSHLENLLANYLNGKITKKELETKYRNYCDIRDM